MKLITGFGCALVLLLISGCSVYMAANQPPVKNIDLFKIGTPRTALLAEFGYPTASETRNGKKYEIYRFTQGYSGGAKAARAMGHGIADVLTLGLWEVIGTPVESSNDGDLTAYEVSYDSADRVDLVVALIQNTNTTPAGNSPGGGNPAATSKPNPDLSTQVPSL